MSWFRKKRYVRLNQYDPILWRIKDVEYLKNSGEVWVKFLAKRVGGYSSWEQRISLLIDFEKMLFVEQ